MASNASRKEIQGQRLGLSGIAPEKSGVIFFAKKIFRNKLSPQTCGSQQTFSDDPPRQTLTAPLVQMCLTSHAKCGMLDVSS